MVVCLGWVVFFQHHITPTQASSAASACCPQWPKRDGIAAGNECAALRAQAPTPWPLLSGARELAWASAALWGHAHKRRGQRRPHTLTQPSAAAQEVGQGIGLVGAAAAGPPVADGGDSTRRVSGLGDAP